jgi:hypothetical protein
MDSQPCHSHILRISGRATSRTARVQPLLCSVPAQGNGRARPGLTWSCATARFGGRSSSDRAAQPLRHSSDFLPFLPMLPTQILLNNFLYDTSQISIPGDNVDPALLHRPARCKLGSFANS